MLSTIDIWGYRIRNCNDLIMLISVLSIHAYALPSLSTIMIGCPMTLSLKPSWLDALSQKQHLLIDLSFCLYSRIFFFGCIIGLLLTLAGTRLYVDAQFHLCSFFFFFVFPYYYLVTIIMFKLANSFCFSHFTGFGLFEF